MRPWIDFTILKDFGAWDWAVLIAIISVACATVEWALSLWGGGLPAGLPNGMRGGVW